jgi:hypothetical protein
LRQSLFHLCSSALFVSIALPLRLWWFSLRVLFSLFNQTFVALKMAL